MTKLNEKDISRIAKLADLSLTNSEVKKFTKELGDVVEYFDTLNEVDTGNTKPTSQTTGLTNVLREDTVDVNRILSKEEALSNSEKVNNNYFKVNAVINKTGDVENSDI